VSSVCTHRSHLVSHYGLAQTASQPHASEWVQKDKKHWVPRFGVQRDNQSQTWLAVWGLASSKMLQPKLCDEWPAINSPVYHMNTLKLQCLDAQGNPQAAHLPKDSCQDIPY
jgi:hypothetical protein